MSDSRHQVVDFVPRLPDFSTGNSFVHRSVVTGMFAARILHVEPLQIHPELSFVRRPTVVLRVIKLRKALVRSGMNVSPHCSEELVCRDSGAIDASIRKSREL